MAKIAKTAENLETSNAEAAEAAAAQVSAAQAETKQLKEAERSAAIETLFEGEEASMPAVTSRSTGTAIAAHVPAEPDNFGELDDNIGYGSFPIVKLENGKLCFSDSDLEVENFECVILGVKKRWLYKSEPGDEAEVFYSYDKQTDTAGRSVNVRLDEWKAEGYDPEKFEIKEYVETMAKVTSGEFANRLVLLSVPPASTKRLAGVKQELKFIHKLALDKSVIKVSVGKKVKVGSTSFNPWNFDFVRALSPGE